MTLRLLAVDTASEICGVALNVDGRVHCEMILDRGGTHTRTVMAAVDAVCATEGLTVRQVDAFVVTQGPGSFTGLRIGISTVKGLATAMDKPLVGILSLDVLAHQACGHEPLVCSLLDARRNEVYWRLYRRDGQALAPLTPARVGPVEQIAPHIDAPCVLIGNGAEPYRPTLAPLLKARAIWAPAAENGLRPSVLSRLGWESYGRGETQDVSAFEPVYLRKSDAELNRPPA